VPIALVRILYTSGMHNAYRVTMRVPDAYQVGMHLESTEQLADKVLA
jgi:hypothetical protein